MSIPGLGSWQNGDVTATAGTAIAQLIPPRGGAYTRLISMWYRAGATQHLLQVLRQLGSTALNAVAAGGQAVVILAADPSVGTPSGSLQANQYVALQTGDGHYFLTTIASVSGLIVTLNANLPTIGAKGGAPFYFFGKPVDQTNGSGGTGIPQSTGLNTVGPVFNGYASQLNTYNDYEAGLAVSPIQNSPLVVYSPNTTNAGIFELLTCEYTQN